VFFSRITWEDKLGQEYEPYIFAALNSAKIMLAFGTDYEYFNAVWVKNEWSRFLKLMAADKSKHLIPCYKGIDAYDMPKEFAKLQAQDLGKVGAAQDLLRGIEKLLPKQSETVKETVKETVVVQQGGGPNVEALVKRGNMALEDEQWNTAKDCFDQALNIAPECAEAYLGKVMSEYGRRTKDGFAKLFLSSANLSSNKNLQRARQFATGDLKEYFSELEKEREVQLAKRLVEQREEQKKREKEEEQWKKDREQHIQSLTETREHLNAAARVISAGNDTTFGLKLDGTVASVGSNKYHKCNVTAWRNIVAISGDMHAFPGIWHLRRPGVRMQKMLDGTS
jgi:tetratricopeptide (TPR) repeat protein